MNVHFHTVSPDGRVVSAPSGVVVYRTCQLLGALLACPHCPVEQLRALDSSEAVSPVGGVRAFLHGHRRENIIYPPS